MPISIEYDETYEDAITEAVSRLDEIGDLIDGDVPDRVETDLLLYSLGIFAEATDVIAGISSRSGSRC